MGLGDHHIERDHAARVLAFWSDLSREGALFQAVRDALAKRGRK